MTTTSETYTSTTAYIGKCRCGQKLRRDVVTETTVFAFNGRPHSHSRVLTADADRRYGRTFIACPSCQATVDVKAIRGTYSDRKRCGVRCTSAIGPSCDCQCSGENHGADHFRA